MKPSEVIRHFIPEYTKHTDAFMCCMIQGSYHPISGVPYPEEVSQDDGLKACEAISAALPGYATLNTYLRAGRQDYSEILAKCGRAAKETHAYRVKWFEELANELEKEGK